MEIHDSYNFKNDGTLYYVYEGLCDGRQTKWITKTKWDFKIKFKMMGGEILYVDSMGDEILVLEKNDLDDIYNWNLFCKN